MKRVLSLFLIFMLLLLACGCGGVDPGPSSSLPSGAASATVTLPGAGDGTDSDPEGLETDASVSEGASADVSADGSQTDSGEDVSDPPEDSDAPPSGEESTGELPGEELPDTPDSTVNTDWWYDSVVTLISTVSSAVSSSVSDSESDSSDVGTPPEPEWTPANKVKDLVMGTDQYNQRAVVYDFSKLSLGDSLDKAEVWSCNIGYAAGLKYREDTVFGDVIVIAGSTSRIISYPSKSVIWSTTNSGNNPHSIEILPSGNVVIASSTGGTLRLFDSAQKKQTYRQYSLTGAHGVLWDPEYSLLWALGDYDLVCYTVSGSGSSQTLTEKKRYTLPATGGHDLSADFSDTDYLLLTVNAAVYRFDKVSGTFTTSYSASGEVNRSAVKGVGNNPNGNWFYCNPNGGYGRPWANMSIASWCTDTIKFVRQTGWNTYELESYKASTAAFYKVRVFYGKYQ